MEIGKNISLTIETQIEKYLETNLTKKKICEKIHKILLFKGIKQALNKWKRCTKFLSGRIFTTKICHIP